MDGYVFWLIFTAMICLTLVILAALSSKRPRAAGPKDEG